MTIPTRSSESGVPFARSLLLVLTTVFAIGTFPRPAWADDSASAEADTLFRSGLEEMRAGRYEVACPMLAKSYQLDPLPGALFTEADCEAAWGKVATAIEHYQAFVNSLTTMPADRRGGADARAPPPPPKERGPRPPPARAPHPRCPPPAPPPGLQPDRGPPPPPAPRR